MAQNLDTRITMTMDTSQAVSGVDRVTDSVEKLSDSLKNVKDGANNIPSPGGNGSFTNADVTNAQLNQQQSTQVVQQLIQNQNANNQAVSNAVKNNGGGNSPVENAAANAGAGGMLSMLKAAGPVGATAAAALGIILGGNKLVEQYEKVMPDIMNTYGALTDNLSENSAKENSQNMRDMFSRINNRRRIDNVKASNEEYMATMRELSRYGYTDPDSALNDASNILKYENAGMGSRSQLLSMQGLAKRFGLGDALNSAYAGLVNSGMQKGQFDEFLSSMEDILESGISKGFVRAADDIATDLTMLEKLSGGSELWKGQYGAENLSQMNSALSNATNLSSVNDVMLYQAISGLDEDTKKKLLGKNTDESEIFDESLGYINNMMLLERGVTADNIGAIFDMVDSEGGTDADKIARYRSMFGVNYTKAYDIFKMSQNYNAGDAEKVAKTIQDFQNDTENNSTEREMLETYQTVAAEIQKIGGNLVNVKEKVISIADYLIKGEEAEINVDTEKLEKTFSDQEDLEKFNTLVTVQEDGSKTQSEMNDFVNAFMGTGKRAKMLQYSNFQELPLLNDAWKNGDNVNFQNALNNLFENGYLVTDMGILSDSELLKLQGNKEGWKMFSNTYEKMGVKDVEQMVADYEAFTGKNFIGNNGSLYDALQELISLVKNQKITLHVMGN